MSELLNVPGIGDKKIKKLEKLGILQLEDALTYFPRRHEDETNVVKLDSFTDGEKCTILLEIASISAVHRTRSGLSYCKVIAFDEFGVVEITFFNQSYVSKALNIGEVYAFFGVISEETNKITMNSPKYTHISKHKPSLVPIYKICSGITQSDIRKITYLALKNLNTNEFLPEYIIEKYKLISIKNSISKLHFPTSKKDLKSAKRRLDFQRIFLYLLELKLLHETKKNTLGIPVKDTDYSELLKLLKFSLTSSQVSCIDDCISNIQSGFQLNRLIQGDVGSGKTIIATILCYIFAKNSLQSAFVVPTAILATQHFEEINALLQPLNINVALLQGSTKASEKKQVKKTLESGEIDIIIATHAVFTDDVKFKSLSLVVVDEQHRFGVNQRVKMLSKGNNPHTLVMSATPIPRTYSLVLYGDLEISTVSEMPKGRQKIDTFLCNESKRNRVYKFAFDHVTNQNQVYIVCPLIEENDDENTGLKNAKTYHSDIQKIFPNFNIGLMHGKLKAKEKDEIMESFSRGEIDILVSTTVIEVGVNVPNATLMIIENAECFGLSALHQLRGRVGRGHTKSFCILMSNTKAKRLEILTKTSDGFKIAQEDLAIRGSGDYYGNRQSGVSELSTLDFDSKMLECASNEVKQLIEDTNWNIKYPELYKKTKIKIESGDTNIFN